jgi:hypothetical protein
MYDETTTPTTIYVSKVIECTHADWEKVRFPLEVETREATLTVSHLTQVSEGAPGIPDEARRATLRFGRLGTPLGVVVEMTRWTDHSVEIGIRPPRHLPFWVSGDRYVKVAYTVLDRLARLLTAQTAETFAGLDELQKSA